MRKSVLVTSMLISTATLWGCSDDTVEVVPEVPQITEAPEVNQVTAFDGPLAQAGATKVSQFLWLFRPRAAKDYGMFKIRL